MIRLLCARFIVDQMTYHSYLKSYHTCVRAVFRIDFDSSLFDWLLI